MYPLRIAGIQLPECVVAETRSEAVMLRNSGIPYVIKPAGWTDNQLLGGLLFKMLEANLPWIDWEKALGIERKDVDKVIVLAQETEDMHRITTRSDPESYFNDADLIDDDGNIVHVLPDCTEGYMYGQDLEELREEDTPDYVPVELDEFFENKFNHVNLEVLNELRLLPAFLGDITAAIKHNLIGTAWLDGYNKKLGTTVGEFKYGEEAPNLIVLDVSGSIPSGVSYTMVSLIDMLRTQANADLIITSHYSRYFKCDEELPSPSDLSYLVGGSNEASQFNHILEDHIFGRKWGNVIVFGDMHAPTDGRFGRDYQLHCDRSRNTEIGALLAYDTRGDYVPGYGKWALDFVPDSAVEIKGNGWIDYMKTYI